MIKCSLSRRSLSLFSLPFLAPGLLAGTAQAQDGSRAIIEEITVTARKREEALQTIPVSVSAFSAGDIVDRQIRAIEDVARYTPGLSFAKAFGRSTDRPVIRGQGNVLAGVQFGVESGAAYFIDGIYYSGDLSSLDLNNVERVEVIRGPQSALYGRNTYSGAINFVTRSPGDQTSADVRGRWGEDNDIEVTGILRGPLIEGLLAGSLAARYYSYDGEFRNTVTGRIVGDEETRSVSGTLDFTPTPDWLLRTRLAYQEDRDGTRPFFLQPSESNNCFPGTRSNAAWPQVTSSTNNNQYFCGNINRPGNTVALNDGPVRPGWPSTIDLLPGFPNLSVPPGTWQLNQFVTLPSAGGDLYNPNLGLPFSGVERDRLDIMMLSEWDINGSGWLLSASLGFRDETRKTGSDSDHSQLNFLAGNPAPGVTTCTFCASVVDEYEDIALELRLESPADERLRWMVGAFYFDQDQVNRRITFAQLDGGAPLDELGVRNWAGFGMIEYDFSDRISGTAELRYFDEKKSLKEYRYGAGTTQGRGNNTVYDAFEAQTVLFDESASFDAWAPRLSLSWQALDDVLLYAIWAQGYKPGGLNGTAGSTVQPEARPEYEQESSNSYEIGVKTSWFDNRLLANVGFYFIDSKKIQLTTPLSAGGGTLTSIVTNQGAGETFGLELELLYALTEELTVGMNYALADTKFTSGCDADQWILTSGGGVLNDANACTGNDLNGQGNGSIKGKQFPLSSKHQIGAFADYRVTVSSGMELFSNIGVSWEDKKPVQVHNAAFVPAATILDAKIGFETERWTVSLYGRNLTNEDAPSMVTRWLQDPLLAPLVGAPDIAATGTDPSLCTVGTASNCSTNYPRAFFGDFRRSRNFGIEFAWRFGG